MAAEATGSRMPIIKNELKYKIQKKRRESGLEELQVQYKKPEPEVVSSFHVYKGRTSLNFIIEANADKTFSLQQINLDHHPTARKNKNVPTLYKITVSER